MTETVYKRCKECGELKEAGEFWRRKLAPDGLQHDCKDCQRRRKGEWQRAHPERQAATSRRYVERNPKRAAERIQRDREKSPEKYKARLAVRHAVKQGKIIKPESCEDCGKRMEKSKLHGHHEDYSKILEVEWLCSLCHGLRHSKDWPSNGD